VIHMLGVDVALSDHCWRRWAALIPGTVSGNGGLAQSLIDGIGVRSGSTGSNRGADLAGSFPPPMIMACVIGPHVTCQRP
jgi:hypothetical protein